MMILKFTKILEKHKSERFFFKKEKNFSGKKGLLLNHLYDIEFENITLKNWPF